MSSILAIDTSTPACSVALAHTGGLLAQYVLEDRSHTRLLLPMVNSVLQEAEMSLNGLDAIAITVGPGSFTGLRIGLGLVQGLALATNLPVIACSTLQLLAQTAYKELALPNGASIMTALDARMGDVYVATFVIDDGGLVRTADDQLMPATECVNFIKEGCVGIGEGVGCILGYQELFSQSHIAFYPKAEHIFEILPDNCIASAQSVEEVQLNYLRGANAWRKHQKIVS